MQDKRLSRVNSTQLALKTQLSFPVRIFANHEVPVEPAAVDELLSVLDTQTTLDRLGARTDLIEGGEWNVEAVIATPDFHKGAGIPIGTVIKTRGVILPQAIGNDINCGMRLHTTNLDASGVSRNLEGLETVARRLFFEGGRQIPMTGLDREALLKNGLSGIMARSPWDRLPGQWQTIVRSGCGPPNWIGWREEAHSRPSRQQSSKTGSGRPIPHPMTTKLDRSAVEIISSRFKE